MLRVLTTVGIVLFAAAGGRAADIYQLIVGGDLKEAADSLSSVSTAMTRDGDLLFYAGMLETDGEKSIKLMQAALQAAVSSLHQEQIYYRLAQYYLLSGDMKNLGRIVTEYLTRWEFGQYRAEMMRYSILVDDRAGEYESALRQVDRYSVTFSSGDVAQWGQVDKARILLHNGKKIGAGRVLRELTRKKSGAGVPPSLYLLALDAIAEGNTDDAVFYYSVLRESFPAAVGVDALLDRMADVSTGSKSDHTADKITGTYYSVQLGVFSQKGNAQKMVNDFKKYDRPLDLLKKKISDKSYHVVYIGRFPDYNSAARFKQQLEAEHGASYIVVAR